MITDGAPCADVSAHVQVSRLMDGYLATQLLYVAAVLGLADALAGAPQPADALARAVGAEPDALCRVLQGVLLDQAPVVARAWRRLASAGLVGRYTCVAGDFFAGVPPGGDAYLLSRVIHDWDDEAAVRILTNCRRAMGPEGTLLLVEVVLPTRASEQPAAIRMDLHMLTLLHGRERTAAEYERLLGTAGFRLMRVVPTRSPAGVSVIEAVPMALH
jgi:O-methyltransferase domain